LGSLSVLHPAPDRIRAILDALGEHEVEVDAGTEPEECVGVGSHFAGMSRTLAVYDAREP
jgi:hypothetical protein